MKKYLLPIVYGAVAGVVVVGLILVFEFAGTDESFTFFKIHK